MGSRKCFVYCNDCAGYVVHDNTEPKQWEGKKSESCSIYCNKCKHIITHPKSREDNDDCSFVKKSEYCDDDDHHDDHDDNSKEKCTLAETLVSVRDPTSDIFVTSPQTVDLTGWSDLVIDAKDSFDNESGIYTALCDGDYEISLVVNYRTAFPITLDTPLDVGPSSVDEPDNDPFNRVPRIELYDVCTCRVIVASQFPTVHSIVTCPCPITGEAPVEIELRSILGAGEVIINTVVPLEACQRIRFRVVLNGLEFPVPSPIPPNFPAISLSAPGSSTTASFKKLRDTPDDCDDKSHEDYSDEKSHEDCDEKKHKHNEYDDKHNDKHNDWNNDWNNNWNNDWNNDKHNHH